MGFWLFSTASPFETVGVNYGKQGYFKLVIQLVLANPDQTIQELRFFANWDVFVVAAGVLDQFFDLDVTQVELFGYDSLKSNHHGSNLVWLVDLPANAGNQLSYSHLILLVWIVLKQSNIEIIDYFVVLWVSLDWFIIKQGAHIYLPDQTLQKQLFLFLQELALLKQGF